MFEKLYDYYTTLYRYFFCRKKTKECECVCDTEDLIQKCVKTALNEKDGNHKITE